MAKLNQLDLKQLHDLCLKIIDHKEKSHTYRSERDGPDEEVKMYRVRTLIDTRDKTYEAAIEYKERFEQSHKRLQELNSMPRVEGRAARFVDGPDEVAADIKGFLRQRACALIEVLDKSKDKYEKLADEVLRETGPNNPEIRPRRP